MRTLTDGAVNALYVIGGKAASRAIGNAIPLPQTGATGIAVKVGVALGVGMVADAVLPNKAKPFVVAGALMSPIESILVSMNIPFVSGNLGSYVRPRAVRANMGSYVQPGRTLGMIPARIRTSPTSPLGSYVNQQVGLN
jgi:hypothetical protein